MKLNTTILAVGICGLIGTTAVSTARAQDENTGSNRAAGRMEQRERRIVGTISAIDKENRTVTVTDDQGQKETFKVSSSMTGFDKLKKGDRVDVTHTESVAVSLGKPGEKPSVTTREAREPGSSAMQQVHATVQVVSVNAKKHEVTIRKPDGTTQTMTIEDPQLQEKLSSLKPGDTIDAVYTETVAGKITPAKK
jgi:hypothetical protein